MEHRWGQRSAVCLRTEVRALQSGSKAVGLILDMSISGALIRTALDVIAFSGVEVQVNGEWQLAWVTRRAAADMLAVEWMVLAPDAVVRQLEVAALKPATLKLPTPRALAVA